METSSTLAGQELYNKNKPDIIGDGIREEILKHSKDFKTSWIGLGQALYSVWKDKLYRAWGYEKFEYYTEQEVGLKNSLAIKLLRSYYFLEQEEPDYLQKDHSQESDASLVPNYDAVDFLRLAKKKKEIGKTDYIKFKKDVFEKGRDASALRKDLTALIKERKPVDPEEERDKRNTAAVKKLVSAISSFRKDMEVLKLLPDNLVQEAEELMEKLEAEIS